MPKLEIKATELTDTDVNFVALVKRGANRIPFRVTKGEDEMSLDLYSLGRRLFQKADPAPTAVAVVTQKGVDLVALKAKLAKAGVDVATFVEKSEGDIVTLAKADAPSQGVILVKHSAEVAVAYTGLQKSFCELNFESQSFGDVFAQGSYCASLGMASDMLALTVANILYSNDAPSTAAEAIGSACDDFKSYIVKMTKALPVQAFKTDAELRKADDTGEVDAAKAKKKPGEDMKDAPKPDAEAQKADAGKNGTGAGAAIGSGTETDPKATADDKANTAVNAKPGEKVSKGAEAGPQPTGESQAGEGAAQSTDQDSEAAKRRASAEDKKVPATQGQVGGDTIDHAGIPPQVLKNEGDAEIGKKGKGEKLPDNQSGAGAQQKDVQTLKGEDGPVMQAIASLAKSVQDGMATLTKRLDDMDGQVQATATLAKKTDAALHGTVFNGTESDDAARMQKSEGARGAPPLLDTAYSRRTA